MLACILVEEINLEVFHGNIQGNVYRRKSVSIMEIREGNQPHHNSLTTFL